MTFARLEILPKWHYSGHVGFKGLHQAQRCQIQGQQDSFYRGDEVEDVVDDEETLEDVLRTLRTRGGPSKGCEAGAENLKVWH